MDCKTAQQLVLPYVKRQLNDKELEGFLEHIKHCSECYEELEIYYMIHVALERLDVGGNSSFDIKKLLTEDLKGSENLVRRRKIVRVYRRIIIGLAQAALLVVLLTQAQMVLGGRSFHHTSMYRILYGEPQNEETTKSIEDIDKEEETKKKEKETNRKKQEIVTIPETE